VGRDIRGNQRLNHAIHMAAITRSAATALREAASTIAVRMGAGQDCRRWRAGV